MQSFVLKSFAKLNLSLKIVGKDSSSHYHYISSLFKIINLYDVIKLTINADGSDKITKIFADGILCDKKNLSKIDKNNNSILQSLTTCRQVLMDEFKFKLDFFDIDIKKSIPAFAGLGGGSSNAACIINFAFNMFKQSPQYNELDDDKIINLQRQIAKKHGMDAVFYIAVLQQQGNIKTNIENDLDNNIEDQKWGLNNLYFVSGFGDEVSKINISSNINFHNFDIFLFIDKNYSKLSTGDMYAKMMKSDILRSDVSEYNAKYLERMKKLQNIKGLIENDFLEIVKTQSFEIKSICDFLEHNKIIYGISGAGSCVFAFTERGKFLTDDFSDLKTDFYYTML